MRPIQRILSSFGIRPAQYVVVPLCLVPFSLQAQTDEVHVQTRQVQKPAVQVPGAVNGADQELRNYSKPFRSDVNLVLVPVTVRDDLNQPVTTLRRDNFNIYENEQEQKIEGIWKEDGPVSVGIILDFSKSMSNKLETERVAIKEFFSNANPEDDYFVVAVSDRPEVIANSTDSREDLERRLAEVVPSGNTSLLDGIYVGIRKMSKARYQRRALLIISDGGDNHSYYNAKKIRNMAKEADVLMYSIGIFDNMPVPVFKTIEEKLGQRLLTTITELTGGYTLAADDRKKVPEMAAEISRQLREQYVLAYRPKQSVRDGKWRKIKVQVTPPENSGRLHVDHKKGYFSPA
jgi:Ca-activated chloride channel family protein